MWAGGAGDLHSGQPQAPSALHTGARRGEKPVQERCAKYHGEIYTRSLDRGHDSPSECNRKSLFDDSDHNTALFQLFQVLYLANVSCHSKHTTKPAAKNRNPVQRDRFPLVQILGPYPYFQFLLLRIRI